MKLMTEYFFAVVAQVVFYTRIGQGHGQVSYTQRREHMDRCIVGLRRKRRCSVILCLITREIIENGAYAEKTKIKTTKEHKSPL